MAEILVSPTPETASKMTENVNKKPKKKRYFQSRINILNSHKDWERIKQHWTDVELFQQNKKAKPNRDQDQGFNTLCKRSTSNCIFLRKKVIIAERCSQPAFTSSRLNTHFCDHLLETHEKFCDTCYFDSACSVKTECFDNPSDGLGGKETYVVQPINNHRSLLKSNQIYCTYCHKNFESSYHLIDHVLKKHVTPSLLLFGCPLCDSTFTTKEHLNLHFPTHSSNIIQLNGVPNLINVQTSSPISKPSLLNAVPAATPFELILPDETDNVCSLCFKEFETETLLLQHLNMHTLKIKFCCHICKECSFFEKKKLLSHYTTHKRKNVYALLQHTKDPATPVENETAMSKKYPGFQCILCQKVCFERMDYHLKNHHPAVQYYVFSCHICEMYFGSVDEISIHFGKHCKITDYDMEVEQIKDQPSERSKDVCPFQCQLCPGRFSSKDFLDKHEQRCGKTIVHQCSSCDKKYSSKQALDNHIEFKHVEKEKKLHSCNICGQSFSNSKFLKKHEKNHLAKKHKCPECGKGPFDRRILKQHLKTHKKPCTCGDCPECNEIKELFACQICQKIYKTPYLLKRHHKIIHEGIITLKFECYVCSKRFRESGTLKRHIKTHENICNCGTCDFCMTRDPRTKCDVCSKIFATMHHLNRHKVVHTGERNFVCEICGKGFNQAGNLKVHVKSHMRRMEKEK